MRKVKVGEVTGPQVRPVHLFLKSHVRGPVSKRGGESKKVASKTAREVWVPGTPGAEKGD